jgi:hypothetical protein
MMEAEDVVDEMLDEEISRGEEEGYHRGSPKLLHMYKTLGRVKDELKTLEAEKVRLLVKKAEFEEKIMYENAFLDRMDYEL